MVLPSHLLELEDLIQDEHIFLIDEIKNLENLNEKSKYKIKDLRNELDQSFQEIKDQKLKYIYCSDKLKNLNIKLKNQENIIDDLKADIQVRLNYSETSYQKYQTLVNELEVLKYENSKLIQNKEKFFDNDKKLKDQNLNLLKEINDMSQKMKKLETYSDDLKFQLDKKLQSLVKTEAEINQSAKLNQTETNNKQISELKEEIEKKDFVINDLSKRINELWVTCNKENQINISLRAIIKKYNSGLKLIDASFREDL